MNNKKRYKKLLKQSKQVSVDMYDPNQYNSDEASTDGFQNSDTDPVDSPTYNFTPTGLSSDIEAEYVQPTQGSVGEFDDAEKTKIGQFFGFIRGRYDQATANFKQDKIIKAEAYNKYLEAKPLALQEKYDNFYNEKLNRIIQGTDKNQWQMAGEDISSGVNKIAQMLGGNKNYRSLYGFSGPAFTQGVPMDELTGFKATVLGPLPRSRYTEPSMSQFVPQTGRTIQQLSQVPTSGGYTTPKFDMPGNIGSQVPKYQAYPSGATNPSQWSRVVKIDKYGKKRSFLRKSRAPGSNITGPTITGPSSAPYPYQSNTGSVAAFMGPRASPENIMGAARTREFNVDERYGGNITPAMDDIPGAGDDFKNMVNRMVPRKGSQFNPNDFR